MWLVNQEHTVQYAEEVYTVTPREDNKAVTLLCPTRKIFSRGDTLNLSTLSLEIEAQIDGVISLEVTHHAGTRRVGPDFELFPDGKPDVKGEVQKSAGGKDTTVKAGALSATISGDEHTFDIKFHATDGSETLTSLLNRSVGLAYSPALNTPKQVEDMTAHKHYVFTQTELGVGESIHGLGERFGAWNKIGQSIEVWNEDGGTSSEQAYKNISFWLSSRGYGVFIDTPNKIDLEIGSERCCRLQTTVEGQRLKWYIIYGPTPKEVLTKYSILTGKSNRVPAWSYGLWLSTSFTTSYSEETVQSFVSKMSEFLASTVSLVRLRLGPCVVPGSSRTDQAPQRSWPHQKSKRVDQSVYRSSKSSVQIRCRQRVLAQEDKRRCLAMGFVADGDGCCRFYKSRGMRMVPEMHGEIIRHGRRLNQDRLWRTYPHQKRTMARHERGPKPNAQLLCFHLQQNSIRIGAEKVREA
jgi:hypothetical protein